MAEVALKKEKPLFDLKKIKNTFKSLPSVVWMLSAIVIIFSFTGKNFFTIGNLRNIIIQASPFLILALGETMAILIGGIDLSVGYVMGFCGVVVAMMMNKGLPWPLAVLSGVLTGGICGFINGFLVSRFKMPYFIVTYGVGNMVYGLGSIMTKGVSQPALNRSFRFLADGRILSIPFVFLLAITIFIIAKFLIKKTSYGRNMYGLGGNREALFLSGVNIKRAENLVFIIVGLLAGIAGVIFAARSASGHPSYGVGWEFDAVAATIIGGNSFSEGKGNINKTILGVLFIQILKTGLNISGVIPQAQSFLIGLIVVVAISTDVLIQNKK